MANGNPFVTFENLGAWVLGLLGTISLAWVGTTSSKVNKHEVQIAVLKEGQQHIKESLNRLENYFGTKPREEQ